MFKCCRMDCAGNKAIPGKDDYGLPIVFQAELLTPVFTLVSETTTEKAMVIDRLYCVPCSCKLNAEDIMTNSLWAQIVDECLTHGFDEPLRELTTLSWDRNFEV